MSSRSTTMANDARTADHQRMSKPATMTRSDARATREQTNQGRASYHDSSRRSSDGQQMDERRTSDHDPSRQTGDRTADRKATGRATGRATRDERADARAAMTNDGSVKDEWQTNHGAATTTRAAGRGDRPTTNEQTDPSETRERLVRERSDGPATSKPDSNRRTSRWMSDG